MNCELFVSKVIDENNVAAFTQYGIGPESFFTPLESSVVKFVLDYAKENGGNAPSYATIVSHFPDFVYVPGVNDSYEYLARKIKDYEGKQRLAELINEEFPSLYRSSDTESVISALQERLESIKMGTSVRDKIGRDLTDIKTSLLSEYRKREEGRSFKRYDTPFPSLTKEIGGFFTGDVYGVMAESGRGKTYLLIRIVDSLLRQAARVLVKSYEVKEYVWVARLVSVITAIDETFTDNLGRKLGIPNRDILSGKLEDIVRDRFFEVVEQLDSYYPGQLYFQGKSDKGLTRTLDDLDAELSRVKVDAVVLDPFYGLADVYGRNANNTAGGAAEHAATRFENIIGDHDVIGFYTVQATVERKQSGDDGVRELHLPTRDQVMTTKRLLAIATVLFSFDSVEKEGIARIGCEKGRNGGEDFVLDLIALFDYGVLCEFPTGQDAASQFSF
ncbi:AAA family ATPase [Paenibacillus campinasensis]|uniref:DNA helicase n=1 Tax=Paenibacillus campinasensis TaxID=66347 RepID=A0A268EH57_9BACL|nr:AAA family ATPase [Paenibacillus campinasensis]PAD72404.1 DNA helicase [Paenibacillus campinasensis]